MVFRMFYPYSIYNILCKPIVYNFNRIYDSIVLLAPSKVLGNQVYQLPRVKKTPQIGMWITQFVDMTV